MPSENAEIVNDPRNDLRFELTDNCLIFNNISTCLGVFYAKRLENRVFCTQL